MTPFSSQDIVPPQLLAKKLNNRAARCIEIGCHDAAIPMLVRALKIWEQLSDAQLVKEKTNGQPSTCPCSYCSLDYCMAYSQKSTTRSDQRDRSFPPTRKAPFSDGCDAKIVNNNQTGGGYVYRHAIRVSAKSMKEGHSMALVLPLILTFNLALAHHLSALASRTQHRSKYQRILRLYELAYRWQMEEPHRQVDCIPFSMVIANNLGEIHRTVSNHDKHQKCLQHLLSTLMFMVDTNHTCHDNHNHHHYQSAMDMDGFLRNTSKLILLGHCAGAA